MKAFSEAKMQLIINSQQKTRHKQIKTISMKITCDNNYNTKFEVIIAMI